MSPYSRTYCTVTFAFLALALLDTFEPALIVSAAWWIVLLLVWTIPWPRLTNVDDGLTSTRALAVLHQVAALVVFAWLYFRANWVILNIVVNWTIAALEDPWSRFEDLLPFVLTSTVSATLFARPIHRAFGAWAAKAVFIIATPYLIRAFSGSVFALPEWLSDAWGKLFWLCAIVLSPLVLAYSCQRRIRGGHRHPMRHLAQLRSVVTGVARGHFGVFYTSLAFIGVATAFIGAAAASVNFYGRNITLPETMIDSRLTMELALGMALTVSTVLLTITLIGLIRALRCKDFRIGRLQVYGRLTEWLAAILVLTVPWTLTLLHAAPAIGGSAYYTLRYIPGISKPAWRITYDERTATLRLSGRYLPGVAAAFADQLTMHPNTKVIELDGPGGGLVEGIWIGELISARNLGTSVMKSCSSACTYAFAGGRFRTVGRDAQLGFHAGVAPSEILQWVSDTTSSDEYLMTRGFSPTFISAVYAIPSNEMWYPSVDELYKAGVLTGEREDLGTRSDLVLKNALKD